MSVLHLANQQTVVDVEVPESWPQPLAGLINDLARTAQREMPNLADEPDLYVDLELDGHETDVRELLRGHLLRAQHCTRLLDHEADSIRSHGLRLLGPELVDDRLDQAHAHGHLTDVERDVLRAKNAINPALNSGGREDQVCLTLSAEATAHDVRGAWRLLTYWGGEAMYWSHADDSSSIIGERLRSLGRPALVTAHLDLTAPGKHSVFRSIVHTFVGKALGHKPANADVFYQHAIPAQHIKSIAFPGDPAYDRLSGLPAK